MTYIIAEPCIDIKDRSCVDVCPVDCIHEFERILIIDPEECIDCGACEPECPVEAIFPEDALPEKWEPFVKINYAYPDPETINRLVDIVEDIAGVKLKRNYNLGAPKGVRGRNSDNTLIKQKLGWAPGIALRDGIEKTYRWISDELLKHSNKRRRYA